jgi:2-polyprenyl-6-hydroxyphenyl methylase/3-demethylubiquinone-9 3-methyltransferase
MSRVDLRGLEDPAKYDRLVELESATVWWDQEGPLQGLHLVNQVRVPYFEKVLGGYSGKRILDIGCGGGIFAEAATRAGASIVGIDPSKPSIEVAREHARSQGLDIDYRIGFAEQMDLDEQFHSVMAVDVLEHVNDLDVTLKNCARVLRPGGIFGFLTHNQTLEAFEFLIWQGEYEMGFIPKGNHDFHKFIRPEDLVTRLTECGVRTMEICGVGCDLELGKAFLTESPQISYIGFGVKD